MIIALVVCVLGLAVLGAVIAFVAVRRKRERKKKVKEHESVSLETSENATPLVESRKLDWNLAYSELELEKVIGNGGFEKIDFV